MLLYSWDEGLTWQELRFSEDKVNVKNILISSSGSSQQFIIHGETHSIKGETRGFILGVDFSQINEQRCRNPDTPDTPQSDYETWTPNDGRLGHNCLLGAKTIYIRRKQNVQCFNGDFEKRIFVEKCKCTQEDYECDVGFHRVSPTDPCTEINVKSEEERSKRPEKCEEFFTISKGYRKIPGNVCVDGVQFDPIVIPCEGKISFYHIILIVVIVIVVGYFVLNYVGSFESTKPDQKNGPRNKYTNIDHTLTFNEEDNVLFEDKEDQRNTVKSKKNNAVTEKTNNKLKETEMRDIKNELMEHVEEDMLQIDPSKN
jgi:hypothetical protein